MPPLRTRTVKAPKNSPWFNEEIRTARRIRRKLERKWRCSKLEVYRQNYCVQRRIVTDCIVRAKITYYSSQVDGCSGDQKKLFNVVNRLLNKSKTPVLPISDSDIALSSQFSDFFVNNRVGIRNEFSPAHGQNVPSYDVNEVSLTDFEPASETEIKKLLANSPSKSCELDPIPTFLVKECSEVLTPLITNIVNKSLSTGEFPSSLKISQIRHLLKKSGLDKDI